MWGLGQTDVEGLTALKDADVRFFYNASDGDDVFADGLAGNAIWTVAAVRQAGQLHKLPDGIWTFGGPLSVQAVHRRARQGLHGLSPARRTQASGPATRRPGRPARAAPAGRVAAAFALAAGARSWCWPRSTSPRAPRRSAPATCCGLAARQRRRGGGPGAGRLPAAPAAGRRSPSASRSGVAGAALQSMARNPLASPDTLAVNAGALPGRSSPRPRSGSPCRCCRPAASRSSAGSPRPRLVLALSAGGAVRTDPADPRRLGDRAGAGSLTTLLLLLFEQDTIGLFAWGNGSLVQSDLDARDPARPGRRRRRRRRCVAARPAAGHPRASATTPPPCSASTCGAPGWSSPCWPCCCPRRRSPLAGPIGFVGLCAPVDRPAARPPGARAAPAPRPAAAVRHRRRASSCSAPTCCCAPSSAAQARRRRPDRRGHHPVRRGGAGLAGPPAPRRRPDPAAADRAAGAAARPRRFFATVVVVAGGR